MLVTCYYDYTCPYSYRALQFFDLLDGVGDLDLRWSTFSLKETNKDEGESSPLNESDIPSTSVLALALAHAAREADFMRYHRSVFDAMQGEGLELEASDLLELASQSGVDVEAFNQQRSRWLASVRDEQRRASRHWEIFGTPTVVLAEDAAVFLKLAELPSSEHEAARLWTSLTTISLCHPELVEIRRPAQ